MKTLTKHNTEVLERKRAADIEKRRAGVACPKCAEDEWKRGETANEIVEVKGREVEMLYTKEAVDTPSLASGIQGLGRRVECPQCGHKDVKHD